MNEQFDTQKAATPDEIRRVAYWLEELRLAQKREKDWREEADRASAIYETEKAKQYQFNILYSNTETLSPALYSTTPRPLARRRMTGFDPVGQAGAKTIQRMLEFQLDTNEAEYDCFDDLMTQSVLQALVPGRGVLWWKFDAEVGEEKAQGEKVVGELVEWSKFRHGYASSWHKMPWVSREWQMTRDELRKNFGEVAAEVKLEHFCLDSDDADDSLDEGDNQGSLKTATVYEIWDRTERKVLFISPGLREKPLKVVDDPLGLEAFFPCTRPLQFLRRIKRLEPICPYSVYREQAEELNAVTVRINKIVRALKVRGFYDSQIEGMEQLLEQDDNKLLPADNVAALQQGRKLEDAIWLMPLEKLVATLQQLYAQREQVKQVIYEIMGIADILRGASHASETATAQNIKSQWGGLRIKRWQRLVAVFARDNMRILAELSAEHLPVPVIAQMTGLPFVWEKDKQQAQMELQQIQMQLQQMQMMGQPVPPEAQQKIEQLQQVIQGISWEQVQQVISDDTLRNFKIDLETNSTLDPEATEDKQAISEVMMAISQFFQSVGPLIQAGVFPFEAAKAMLLAIIRRYKMGSELEEQLEAMRPPPPPQGGPEAEKLLKEKEAFEQEKQKASEQLRKEQMALEDQKRELQAMKREMEMEAKFQQRAQQMEAEFAKKSLAQELKGMVAEHQLQVKGEIEQASTALKGETQRQAQAMKAHKTQMEQHSKVVQSKPDNSAALEQLAQVLQQLEVTLSSAREIERDPKTGKALRSRVVRTVQ